MKESLEDFIRANLDRLDQTEQLDAEAMWEEFKEHKTPSSLLSISWRKWAAAASLLLCISFLGYQLWDNSAPEEVSKADLTLVDPSLGDYQAQLVNMIASQNEIIHQMAIDTNEYSEIFYELRQLDEISEEQEKDIAVYGYNPALIRSLLKSYERRIKLLEILLYEVDKKNRYEDLQQERIM